MSITPDTPDWSARDGFKHGSILNGNLCPYRVNSQRKSTDYDTFVLNGQDVVAFARPTYFSNWTGRVAATFTSGDFTSNGGHVTGLLEARYRSHYFLTSTPLRNLAGQDVLEDRNRQPAYWLVNGRLGLADLPVGGSRIAISAFGDNLLDKRYISFGASVLLFTGMYERGRTYGIEVGFSF